jgi:hypothetical protein
MRLTRRLPNAATPLPLFFSISPPAQATAAWLSSAAARDGARRTASTTSSCSTRATARRRLRRRAPERSQVRGRGRAGAGAAAASPSRARRCGCGPRSRARPPARAQATALLCSVRAALCFAAPQRNAPRRTTLARARALAPLTLLLGLTR